jgi:type IV secretion system protein VirB10
MPDATQNPSTIENKAPKPPGLMPKNLQALVISGIAFLMILVMALTGHKRPAMPTATNKHPLPQTMPVNSDKVKAFKNDIQQEQQQSAPEVEQALLAQQNRLAAQAQQNGQNPYGTAFTSPSPNGVYPPGAYATAQPQRAGVQPDALDAIKEERKKRQYLSLFADNVALTYRKDMPRTSDDPLPQTLSQQTGPAQPGLPPALAAGGPDPFQAQSQILAQQAAQISQEQRMLEQTEQASPLRRAQSPNQVNAEADPAARQAVAHQGSVAAQATSEPAVPNAATGATGKQYVLFEGTIIEALLINRLDGSFTGPVSCLVTNDAYSHDRQHLLIPAGSKVLGEAQKVDTFGQGRLAVAFHRLLMPDGYSVSLDQFKGLDQAGAAALKDKVNNHYLKIFGASLAIGILGAASEYGTGSALTANGADMLRQGFGSGLAISAQRVLDRFLNILPTVTIREGARVKIYLSNDLLLPDYSQHQMPSDL